MRNGELARIPEGVMGCLNQLNDGRQGVGQGCDSTPAEAAQSTSPPLLCGEIQLTEEQAREFQRFFQKYRDAAVEKPPDAVRGRMIVAPRRYEKLSGSYYVEFEALAFL